MNFNRKFNILKRIFYKLTNWINTLTNKEGIVIETIVEMHDMPRN